MGDDVDVSLHVDFLLYRQTMPIARWLPSLKKMNTSYIQNCSRINNDRRLNHEAAGSFLLHP